MCTTKIPSVVKENNLGLVDNCNLFLGGIFDLLCTKWKKNPSKPAKIIGTSFWIGEMVRPNTFGEGKNTFTHTKKKKQQEKKKQSEHTGQRVWAKKHSMHTIYADFFHTYMVRVHFASSHSSWICNFSIGVVFFSVFFFSKNKYFISRIENENKDRKTREKKTWKLQRHTCAQKKKNVWANSKQQHIMLFKKYSSQSFVFRWSTHENARKRKDIECEEPEGKKIY